MTTDQLEKRRRVMRRSAALGHCICDVQQPCPCEQFRQKSICHCAGEQPTVADRPVALTEHVRNAGCASKISKGVLKQVLAGLPEVDDPRVVVGAAAGDDAGVILLSPDSATILTVDVFTPCVDDPYTFGQIAAANSVSDIYAMGGTPQTALSIIGFPIQSLPASAMREILRGGADKMKEAGVSIIGGHSINDEEVKCGFAVVGTSPAAKYIRNAGAQVGDAIVLTKPLGTGIVNFAHQVGRADEQAMREVAQSMAALNKLAGRRMVELDAHAATDVTGFSLMGHLAEIVKNSNVEAVLDFDAIPLFETVAVLARQEVLPGAIERNRESVEEGLLDLSALTAAQQAILFCPETSGGLLIFLRPEAAEMLVREVRGAAVIGQVRRSFDGGRITVTTGQAQRFGPVALAKSGTAAAPTESKQEACCCAEAVSAPAAPAPTASVRPPVDGDLPAPAGADAFRAYMGTVSAPGALGTKHKKLISLALSVMSKCEPCVKINAKAAREVGATEQEIAEAVSLGIAFGGAPVAMFYNTVRHV